MQMCYTRSLAIRSFLHRRFYRPLVQGVYQGEERRRHLLAIRNLHPQADEAFEHDYLYECLSILDSKAIGLLTYDAIILAATSLVLSISHRNLAPGPIVIIAALILTVAASALCLSVIWIFWTETIEFEDPQVIFIRLLDVRNRRTVAYRLAWGMSQAGMFLFVVGLILERTT